MLTPIVGTDLVGKKTKLQLEENYFPFPCAICSVHSLAAQLGIGGLTLKLYHLAPGHET